MSDPNAKRTEPGPCTGPDCDHISHPQPSGLPQSEHGGLHPELRARITAATAALGDFDRLRDDFIRGRNDDFIRGLGWIDHAHRLAAELRSLLTSIENLP